jgi:hypothetical protein
MRSCFGGQRVAGRLPRPRFVYWGHLSDHCRLTMWLHAVPFSWMIQPEGQERSCGFLSLGEAWCDTTTDVGRLVMTIMGGIGEFERSLIRSRCDEGIARAKRKGTKFGRPSALDAGQRRKIADRYAAGETMANLAIEYDVSEPTIWRALRPFEASAA